MSVKQIALACSGAPLSLWIWCSGTLPYFTNVRKGNVRHVTAGKVRGTPFVQLYSGSVLITPIGGTFARRSCDAQY